MKLSLPFNPGSWKTQLGVGLVLILLFSALATKCRAAEPAYMQGGVGSAVVRGPAPVIDVTIVYPNRVKDASYELGATLIGESSFRDANQRNNFALHASIVDGLGRFDVGLGAAYLQNTDEYNGSHLNFHLLLQYRFRRWPVVARWQHFSNAGTQSPNRGRDMALLYRLF